MNQKMLKERKTKLLFLLIIILFQSCQTKKTLYEASESSDYPSNEDIILLTDSIYTLNKGSSFKIQLKNNTDNSILIPINHLKAQLLFTNENIKAKSLITPNYSFNNVTFESLSNKKRKEIIENLCIPYVDSDDYEILKSKETRDFICKLENYAGIKSGENYNLKVRFQLTDEIKEYCPKFWSGKTTSGMFTIITNDK